MRQDMFGNLLRVLIVYSLIIFLLAAVAFC